MEVALLCFSAALLALCPGALSLPQGIDRASPSPSPGPGILSSSRRVPYPLYMMQLYRTLRAEHVTTKALAMGPASGVRHDDNPGLHQADAVINLVAKGKKNTHFFILFPFINGFT